MRPKIGLSSAAFTALAVSVLFQGAGCSLLVSLNGLDDGSSADASPDRTVVMDSGEGGTAPTDSAGVSSPETGGADATDSAAGATDAAMDAAIDAAMDSGLGGDADAGLAPPAYLGCFQDSMTRDLPYQAYDSQLSTTAACVSACIAKGYLFAGTQSGSQCFCGNAYGGQGPAGACTSPCTGDPTEACGGGWQNSVYAAGGPVPKATYIGCYTDSMTRELPNHVFDSQYTTVENCAADCAYHGYLYAGPENGNQCFCGDSYGTQGPSGACTDPCTGNAAEVCGGFNANSIYRTWVPADAGSDSGDAGSDG